MKAVKCLWDSEGSLLRFWRSREKSVRKLKDLEEDEESVEDVEEESVVDTEQESVVDDQEEEEDWLPDEYVPTEVVVETVNEDWTEENLAAYAAKLSGRLEVGLPEKPVHNLVNTEDLL